MEEHIDNVNREMKTKKNQKGMLEIHNDVTVPLMGF